MAVAVATVEAIAVTDAAMDVVIAIKSIAYHSKKKAEVSKLPLFFLVPSNCTTCIASLIPLQCIRQHA